MEIERHQEIRDHFVELRDGLRHLGVDGQQLADLCGVKRQTAYQYGFNPEARGARVIFAETLDYLRLLYTERHFESIDKGYPAFLNREDAEWVCLNRDSETKTTCRSHAKFLAAVNTGVAYAGDNNICPERDMNPAEAIALQWLELYWGDNIAPDDAMEVTGLDRHDVGRVGFVWFTWGIRPTEAQVEAMQDRRQHNIGKWIAEDREFRYQIPT